MQLKLELYLLMKHLFNYLVKNKNNELKDHSNSEQFKINNKKLILYMLQWIKLKLYAIK